MHKYNWCYFFLFLASALRASVCSLPLRSVHCSLRSAHPSGAAAFQRKVASLPWGFGTPVPPLFSLVALLCIAIGYLFYVPIPYVSFLLRLPSRYTPGLTFCFAPVASLLKRAPGVLYAPAPRLCSKKAPYGIRATFLPAVSHSGNRVRVIFLQLANLRFR